MNLTEKIILVILAAALALFLILSIIAICILLRVLKNIRHITEKAEKLVDSVEAVGDAFRRSTEQLTFFRLIRNVADMVMQHKSKQKEE